MDTALECGRPRFPRADGVEDDDLRLTDGVGADRVAQTLRDYVVTEPAATRILH